MKRDACRWLRVATLVVVVAIFCLPVGAAAVPKEGRTPGEVCSEAGSRADRAQCCEEAFAECLGSCPRGQSGPSSECGGFCDQTVRQPCLQEAVGQAGPTTSAPRATGGSVLEPRRGGAMPGRLK